MKKRTRLLSFLLVLCMLVPMLPIVELPTFASNTKGTKEDAMTEIKADTELTRYQQGETMTFDDDGYIGIPYEVTVYYDDATHGVATPGHSLNGATATVLYVVNTNVERIGTDSDTEIIKSLLDRGYVVVVLDYLNNEKAVSPDLDYSAQLIRSKLAAGEYFKNTAIFNEGTYEDSIIVPAGYNIRLNDVFFEMDKHGTDGTLEFYILKWNTDLRYHKADVVIPWVRPDGSRKATQNGYDGSSPVWYSDAEGKTQDSANGTYIKLKHTLAEDIADCVKPDGTPIDLNLYLHVIYPTNPKNEVPVMAFFSTGRNLIAGDRTLDRPHLQGFLFGGYAGVMIEYAHVPMFRWDHFGEFGQEKTGYGMGYGVHYMNATIAPAAAIRYARYLALSEPETYAFDINKVGLYGISRCAWMTQLGSQRLRDELYTSADGTPEEVAKLVNDKLTGFVNMTMYEGHHGETRYDNGITESYTKNGVTIDGGELQPWTVYNGNEISSGVQTMYSATGGVIDYVEEGTSPMFSIENLLDTATEYSNVNRIINICRELDLPIYWYEANIGHTFANGPDYNYGVDTYDALFRFAAYYLKDAPVSVSYTNPLGGSVVRTTDGLTVKFIGEVSAAEIEKVSVTDENGVAVNGVWSSAYGETEWTFTAYDMQGGKTYTMTVPANMKGKNGVEMGEAYVTTFHARAEDSSAIVNEGFTLSTAGTPIDVTIPTLSDANSFNIRVRVDSATANEIQAYDAETNAFIGSVRVHGAGYYEIDATEYVAGFAEGTKRTVILKTVADENDLHYQQDFDSGKGNFSNSTYTTVVTDKLIDGETVVGVNETLHNYKSGLRLYRSCEGQWAVKDSKVINGGAAITHADIGRTFRVTVRVYDTVDRHILVWLNGATSQADTRIDYDWPIQNIETKANEWVEFTIPYTVYDTKYLISQVKELNFHIPPTGNTEMPIYIDSITVEEIFEPISVGAVSLVGDQSSDKPVKAPASEKAFLVGGAEYATWKEAMSAATSGGTVKLQSNYTLTDSDLVNLSDKTSLTIDLGGYRLLAKNTKNAPLWLGVTNTAAQSVTLKNGSVVLYDTALIGHDSSTSAGKGKSISVSLEDLYLTVAKDAYMKTVLDAGTIASGVTATVDVTLTDTVLDLTRSYLPFRPIELFGSGNADVDVNYTVCGGAVKMDRASNRTALCNSLIKATPNTDGEYFKLYCSAWGVSSLASFVKDGEYSSLKELGLVDGYRCYTLAKADIVTEYGAVPAEKKDSTFLVFQNGKLIGDTETWPLANKLAHQALDNKPTKTVSILMTKDNTVSTTFASADWMAQMSGDVIFDLGGHTIIADAAVFEVGIHSSYTGGSQGVSFTVKNGTVLGGKGNIFVAQNQTSYDKNVSFTFEDVDFGIHTESFADNRDAMFRAGGGSVTGTLAIDMSFKNCSFDFRGVPTSLKSYRMFYAPGNNNTVNFDISVYGGELIADSLGNIKWYELDNGADTVRFLPDENGDYVTLDVPNGVKASGTVPTDGGIVSFSKLITDGDVRDVYTISNESIKTEYGELPWGAAGNTFVIFKDGKFLSGVDTWKQANVAARSAFDEDPGSTVAILMQKNHSVTENFSSTEWYGFMNGHIIYDLGGNTLIAEKAIFEAGVHSSYIGSNYEAEFTVKNGTILGGAGNILTAQNQTAYDKDMIFTFEDIDFGINPATIASNRDALVRGSSSSKGGVLFVTMTFTDCRFDLRDWPATNSTYRLFYSPANNDAVVFEATVYGCELFADNLANISLCEFDQATDTVYFEPDENDNYITLSVPNGVNPSSSSISVPTTEGICVFSDLVTDGAYRDVYAISVGGTVTTEYGRIPAENIGNTFAIFKDGNFVSGVDSWKQANVAVRKALDAAPGSTVTVLMRKNHSVTENFSSTEWYGFMKGHVVFDLGGNTLVGEKTIFEAGIHANYTGNNYDTSFTVKNGTILGGAGYIFTAQNKTAYSKEIKFTFQNVDFGLNASTVANNRDSMFMAWGGSAAGTEKVTMTFTDCSFDLRNWPTSYEKMYRLFQAPLNDKTVSFDVTVYGGEILLSTGRYSLCEFDKITDHVCFKPDTNGKMLTINVPNGVIPARFLPTENGYAGFTLLTDGGDRDVYELESIDVAAPVETVYGTVPSDKASATVYPFVLFDANKKFVAAARDWKEMLTAANTYLASNSGATVYALMRTNQDPNATLTSVGVLGGTLVLDLGGYTLARGSVTLIEACTNGLNEAQCASPTSIVIKNGTMLATNKSYSRNAHFISYRSNGGYDKTIDITFDSVRFAFANVSGGDVKAYSIIAQGVNPPSGATGVISSELRLKDCIFDFTGSAGTSKPSATNVFNLQNASFADTSDIRLILEGGGIEGDASVLSQIACLNNNHSTVMKVDANDKGEYPLFHLTGGTNKVPASLENVDGETVQYREIGTESIGGVTWYTYAARPNVMITGASVSLGKDLSVNYYVSILSPNLVDLSQLSMQFEMNGKKVLISAEAETVDGEYVFVLTGIAPQQMADLIDATLLEGETVLATHTGYSIKQNCIHLLGKSAEQLGMGNEKYEAMKVLVSDLLIYGEAAQNYKNYNADQPITEGVSGLCGSEVLPTDEDKMVLTGNTDKNLRFRSATVYFNDVNTLYVKLVANVTASNADESLVTVTVNGVAYQLSDLISLGDALYVFTTDGLMATQFADRLELTLSYDGETVATLSYSVNAYAYAMVNGGTNNEAMADLALALYRYGASAQLYTSVQ